MKFGSTPLKSANSKLISVYDSWVDWITWNWDLSTCDPKIHDIDFIGSAILLLV